MIGTFQVQWTASMTFYLQINVYNVNHLLSLEHIHEIPNPLDLICSDSFIYIYRTQMFSADLTLPQLSPQPLLAITKATYRTLEGSGMRCLVDIFVVGKSWLVTGSCFELL